MYDLNKTDETPPPILAPAAPEPHMGPASEFRNRIAAITPDLYVAKIFIGLNVAVFLAMLVSGVSPIEPTIDSLIRWGADYGPRTITAGQWWRLVTSMFLHIGIIHIAFNMFVLWQIGPFVERLLGNQGFALTYLVSGIAGAFVSVAWNPFVVSAGASGAIFGLYGALLGFLLIQQDSIPSEVLSPLTKNALIFIGYNAIYGFLRTGTDIAAHVGGLAAGFVCGLCLSVPLTVDPRPRRSARNTALALGAGLVFIGAGFVLPRPADFQAELKKFGDMEKSTLGVYNADLTRARSEHLRDEQLADMVEKDVLPPWSAERVRLGKVKGLRGPSENVLIVLLQYMDGRQQAWSLLAQGLRQHNLGAIRLAMQKQHDAEVLVSRLKQTKP